VESSDGKLRFEIEAKPPGLGLKRVTAYFQFKRSREIRVETHRFQFQAGESIRLFFSYRHTPELVGTLLRQHRLAVREQWITQSGEEGVFMICSSS